MSLMDQQNVRGWCFQVHPQVEKLLTIPVVWPGFDSQKKLLNTLWQINIDPGR